MELLCKEKSILWWTWQSLFWHNSLAMEVLYSWFIHGLRTYIHKSISLKNTLQIWQKVYLSIWFPTFIMIVKISLHTLHIRLDATQRKTIFGWNSRLFAIPCRTCSVVTRASYVFFSELASTKSWEQASGHFWKHSFSGFMFNMYNGVYFNVWWNVNLTTPLLIAKLPNWILRQIFHVTRNNVVSPL